MNNETLASAPRNIVRICAAVSIVISAVALLAMLTGDTLLVVDHAWRIVPAGIAVMLLPGLVFAEFCGIHATTIFEVIAKSFALSLILAVAVTFALLNLHLSITAWVAFVLAWNTGWATLLWWKGNSVFLAPGFSSLLRRDRWDDRAFVALILLLGALLYWHADDIRHVSGENGLVVAYARQAASGLPLDFETVTLRPELRLHNGFLVWQFMLGAISKLAGTDTLIAAYRSRWVIPVIGFSALFFFAINLTGSMHRARAVVWSTAVLAITQFTAIEPDPLARVGLGERPLFVFLGGVHHADAAIDLLLPLLCGYMFQFLRLGTLRSLAMLAMLIVASFFFHPREYFQVMWYGVMSFLTLLVFAGARLASLAGGRSRSGDPCGGRQMVLRHFQLGGMFVVVAGMLLALSTALEVGGEQKAELGGKWELVRGLLDMRRLLFAEPFMNFQMGGYSTTPPSPPNVYSWLALAALLLPVLALKGATSDRRIALLLIVVWWFTTCFVLSEHLLLILTYSEILFTKVRFLPLFAYAVIAVGWMTTVSLVSRLWMKRVAGYNAILTMGSFAIAGVVFAIVWKLGAPAFVIMQPILAASIVTSAGLIIIRAYAPALGDRVAPGASETGTRRPSIYMTVATLLAFALPVSFPAASRLASIVLGPSQLSTMFTEANPSGLSLRAMDFLRTRIPPRSRVQINPLSQQYVNVYAPIYQVPVSIGIFADIPEIDLATKDQHPIYNSRTKAGHFDVPTLVDYLSRKRIDYVFGTRDYSDAFRKLALDQPDHFSIAFEDRAPGDIFLRFF